MDPITISVGSWLLGKVADKGFDAAAKSVTPDVIDAQISKAISVVSKRLQKKYPDILASNINYFFHKEEIMEEIIKLTFKDARIDIAVVESNFDVTTLPSGFVLEFITDLKKEMLKKRELNTLLANSEIYLAITGLKKDVESIAQNSFLTKNSIVRIKNILEDRYNEEFSYTKFLEDYKRNALNTLSEVNFIGLGVKSHIKKNRKRLQEIFVKPHFAPASEGASKLISKDLEYNSVPTASSVLGNYSRVLKYDKLFSNSKNFVVLGNPGAGKSLMCKSIICSILENKKEDFVNKAIFDLIPFRVELRKYHQYKKNYKGGIVKYIAALLELEYGMQTIPDAKLMEIFVKYKTIVFFDGLDEIFDINDKIEVKNDIELFALAYMNSRNVVTSRIIGYEEVRLKSSQFCDINIVNFDEEQISHYVKQWYANEELDDDTRSQDVEGFLSNMHEIDSELITNPLLLSLIVILYRNNLKIPESKLEIYQSCTKTLVDKWDGIKDLNISLDEGVSKRKESIFADLAYWHYTQSGADTSNITNIRVQETIADTIVNKLQLTADYIEGMELAERFLDYAQKRSLYFDNNFTHKTFLEYFTASWIYSNIDKKHKVDERNDLISKYISSNYWYVVLELLLNMIDDFQADNEILDELIMVQIYKRASYPFLLMVLPTLKNISPKVSDKIYYTAINMEVIAMIADLDKYPKDQERRLQSDRYDKYDIYMIILIPTTGHMGYTIILLGHIIIYMLM